MPTEHSCEDDAAQATFVMAVLRAGWRSYAELPAEVEDMLLDRVSYLAKRCDRVRALCRGMSAVVLEERYTPQL